MKTLIVAATLPEIDPFLQKFSLSGDGPVIKGDQFDVLITGVGLINTTYQLTRVIADYELVINAGIAGSFNREIQIGEVVEVVQEEFPEIGAEDGDSFLSIFDLNLMDSNQAPFTNGALINKSPKADLRKVKGLSVNRVHGDENSISNLLKRLPYQPDIESMEGGAVFFVCLNEKKEFVQLRSISNYVERRNREAWNIGLAVSKLNEELEKFLREKSFI